MNRRLVPMPPRRSTSQPHVLRSYDVSAETGLQERPVAGLPISYQHQSILMEEGEQRATTVLRRTPPPLIDFGVLAVTATLIYFLWPMRGLIVLIGMIVFFCKMYASLADRWPALWWFALGFVQGLFGGRYRGW